MYEAGLRPLEIPLGGGLDEYSPVSSLAKEDYLEFKNFRLSKDGKRIEKRAGLFDLGLNESDDIYGYGTYYNSENIFCELMATESKLKRKTHDGTPFSVPEGSVITNITLYFRHKKIAATTVFIYPTLIVGQAYRSGTSVAPTLNTWVTSSYAWTTNPNTSAAWTVSEVNGLGQNDIRAFGITAEQGSGAYAYLTQCYIVVNYTLDSVPASQTRYAIGDYSSAYYGGGSGTATWNVYPASPTTYWDKIDETANDDNTTYIYNATWTDGGIARIFFYFAGQWETVHTWANSLVHPVRFLEIQGKQLVISETGSRMIHTDKEDYQIGITAPGEIPTFTAGSGGSMVAGTYRYAVTYGRSGNYGCESNPIKSLIGTPSFTGTGLDDMTVSGEYTGDSNRTIRVRIDGTTPDTIEVSYDNGATWSMTDFAISTTVYLHYGIILTFGATTGHTATDYWSIVCSAFAVTVTTNQQVTITNIPVSTDSQVDQRIIYRTVLGGATFFWLVTLNDNTTTSFVDNIEDACLGSSMEEDRDILPNGKFSAWWDNRLWVSGTGFIYYSDIEKPEHFDTVYRYINIRQAKQGDSITQLKAYNDSLYIFTEHNIFIVQKKAGGNYGRYLISEDIGCIAPYSMIEANGYLFFFSFRGLEIFNGSQFLPTESSVLISRTWAAVDKTKMDFISAVHHRRWNEIWFAIPDDSSGETNKAIVLNYIKDKFYVFEWHKVISSLSEAKDNSKEIQSYMATRDGYLFKCDYGYQDGTTNIAATLRKGWYDTFVYGSCRHVHIEYEIPVSKTLNFKSYVNFEKTEKLSHNFTGVTPTSTDIELRRPIKDHLSIDARGEYHSFVLSNSENVGGHLKINAITLMMKGGAIKEKISAD